jgi:hypothetical protein
MSRFETNRCRPALTPTLSRKRERESRKSPHPNISNPCVSTDKNARVKPASAA